MLDAGCDGIILKSGELLTRSDVASVMSGKRLVFNQPILERIVERFKKSVESQILKQEALVTNLRGMPFGVKSLEKRQNELVQKLFPGGNGKMGINATRLVVRAFELHILDIDNLVPDEE